MAFEWRFRSLEITITIITTITIASVFEQLLFYCYDSTPITEQPVVIIIIRFNVSFLQLVEGKADLTISIKELLNLVPVTYYRDGSYTPDLWSMLSYRTILVVANVNETVTGIILSGNSTVQCSSEKYKLTFLEFSPNNYKPGLLYTAFVGYHFASSVHIAFVSAFTL